MNPAAYLLCGDARAIPLADKSVQCVVTSPPYWGLRDYGIAGQLGLEPTPDLYVAHLVECFREVRRVLRDDGTVWLNLGDSYASGETGRHDHAQAAGLAPGKAAAGRANIGAGMGGRQQRRLASGLKPKDLVGMPWRVAFALQADGWYLRSDCIWSKPNPMPESVTDRPTRSHEYLFLLSKRATYHYDAEAIKEPNTDGSLARHGGPPEPPRACPASDGRSDPRDHHRGRLNINGGLISGRNRRSVWNIATQPFAEAHFAVMPRALVAPCILAGTSERGACAACGAPWERVVERDKHPARDMEAQRALAAERTGRRDGQVPGPGGMVDRTYTTDWLPTCACNAPTRPCVVLDPFAGAGTVPYVAKELGRVGIGVELKPEYLAMAEKRTRQEVLVLEAST